jgi:hypothetical protein
MVWHPIQAVSFPQLSAGMFGGISSSDFGVFLPQPSSAPGFHVPLQLGEHSRAVTVMKAFITVEPVRDFRTI